MSLSSTTVWEVRKTGAADNGGGFNPAQVDVGTDYSQQDVAQLTLTNGANTSTSEVLTSVTGGFTAAMIGNVLYISAGTNAVVGYYEIVDYTDTNTITLDRAPDDGVGNMSSASFKVGGATDHPQIIATGTTDTTDTLWIKKGVYQYLSDNYILNNSNGYINNIVGYDATRGDNPTLVANMPQFDGQGTIGLCVNAVDSGVRNLVAYGAVDTGGTGMELTNCFIVNCISYNNSFGFYGADSVIINCISYNNVGYGFYSDGGSAINCISYNNSDGFYSYGGSAINCISYNNSDGFAVYSAFTVNCIALNNNNYGFNYDGFHYDGGGNTKYFDYNCYYGNGTNLLGITAGAHDVNSDPLFVDAPNSNFRLKSNSPCKNVGSPQSQMAGGITI